MQPLYKLTIPPIETGIDRATGAPLYSAQEEYYYLNTETLLKNIACNLQDEIEHLVIETKYITEDIG